MLDNTDPQQTAATEQNETAATGGEGASAAPPRRRRRAVSRPAGTPQGAAADAAETVVPAEAPAAAPAPAVEPTAEPAAEKPVRARRTRKRAEAPAGAPEATPIVVTAPEAVEAPVAEAPVKAAKAVKTTRAAKAAKAETAEPTAEPAAEKPVRARRTRKRAEAPAGAPVAEAAAPVVEAPAVETPAVEAPAAEPVAEEAPAAPARRPRRRRVVEAAPVVEAPVAEPAAEEPQAEEPAVAEEPEEEAVEAPAAAPAARPAAAAPAAEAEPPHRVRRRAVRPATAVFQAPVFQEPASFVAPSAQAAPAAPSAPAAQAAPQQPAAAPAKAEAPAAAPVQAGREEEDDEFEYSGVGRRRRVRTRVEPTRRKSGAQAPVKAAAKAAKAAAKAPVAAPVVEVPVVEAPAVEAPAAGPETEDEWEDGRPSRRRRRGGRRRRRGEAEEFEAAEAVGTEQSVEESAEAVAEEEGEEDDDLAAGLSSSRRRRRRRRRSGEAGAVETAETTEDGVRTVVKVREPRRRSTEPSFDPDEVQSIKGSTRLEAKKQRRREGRELGRRRVPIITEAEFLARRESVERVMVVRQSGQRTQIGVLEDGVLVEHYVNKEQATSYVGNVYLGKVQNVLPSMEAAFVDIGKGRNAVLYAGEVNFGALGHGGPRRIESVLKSGQSVLVQVSKDPIGHKGARLTSQISLPGRYLVYVPEGSMTGISRKLPENERARLKQILKKIVPDDAGVIVRTAAEGASEEELTRDVQRLQQQWEDIQKKAATGNAPALLYGEPDMTVRVVRDIFNEDFTKVIVSGDEAWKTIHEYVSNVAPDLAERLQRWTSEVDVFATYRIDEQLMKALDRKVWLPSGGSLVIDRTEAMVVIDVNTGKFVGQGGNLEETVTRNNIEAAEEIVRQLRLRDLGGIIVIDFIDMVLESNRDLVLRRLLECLGRDRTKHQVAEVTSLGLVQMTRKRVGQGLLESFSEPCVHCNGRGVIVHMEQPSAHVHAPVVAGEAGAGSGKRRRRGKGGAGHEEPQAVEAAVAVVAEPVAVEAFAEPAEPVREEIEGQLALEVPGVEAPAEAAPAVPAPVAEAPVAEAPAAAPAGRPRRRAVRKATAPAGSPGTAEIVVLQAKAEAALEAALEAAAPAVAEAAAEAVAEAPGEPVVAAEAAVVAEAPEAVEAPETAEAVEAAAEEAPAPKKRAARKTAAKKTAAKKTTTAAKKTTARKTATKRTSAAAKKAAAAEGDTASE
ncbi:ribonuclease E/G [Kitasatospora xanthocidica]|uniref:Ribonuclease E n=1 Tax=Kitasatospora xanthocidica TaxID=83382 RepID=A0A372ZW89_9ACTN|nr:Rne/Rng family ribonuclease [Kitasatospora xanthocidica]RGD59587.1 ribonuclease E/G [Kitasatospora xanthocidica]